MSDFLETMFPEKAEENQNDNVVLSADEIADITQRFSGINQDGSPKTTVSYCAYDFHSPEDDPDRENIHIIEDARLELCLDHTNGFYSMDLIFDSPDNKDLKLMWSCLQRHHSNEVYQGDKMWIFYINLLEKEPVDENVAFTGHILNPLMFSLTRQVSNQDLSEDMEEEIEHGIFQGGNVIRFVLHKDLVSFQYATFELEESDENEA